MACDRHLRILLCGSKWRCDCNFLEPGSVGASNLGHPSLVVFSVIEEQMVLSMLGSLCDAAVIQVVFSASPPRSDPSFSQKFDAVRSDRDRS